MTDPEFTADHYSQAAFEFETKRLTELCRVEFEMTKRMLDRWIPDGARIAEIGVGVGHYSEHLAARGCRINRFPILPPILFGVTPSDPTTFAGMLIVLTAVAAMAGYLPARRASRIDPMVALRAE